ncbi:hypothetical protein QAD02_011930 [Eretmocerus hayati]|uniref:Uncharacterized protein n=1 Tax=Eretmocerus hayati TaxID=131215 RepID=A0ACC2P0U0_9HYME|nr:hypothetical protein QAD02_011930 [Eretmocerus hayati]
MKIFSVTTTIIVWLSISKFCSAGGDHGNSLNSVLSVLADISWSSVEKIKIFDDYEGLHKKIDLTQNTDLYFNTFLRSCKGDEGLLSTVEATLRNLTELIFLSSKISLDLSRLLDFEFKSEKGDLEGYFGNLILKYIPSNPLEQIRDIVSVDSFSKSFSVGVYQV